MSFESVQAYFGAFGMAHRVRKLNQSSATVDEAAAALGCEPARIAKTMSFLVKGKPVLVVAAGDARVDNRKFKETFHDKARMIPGEAVEEWIGHAPGGVCPFAVREGVSVFLDESMKRFEIVYPAGGSSSSAVELSIAELERYSASQGWISVCSLREDSGQA